MWDEPADLIDHATRTGVIAGAAVCVRTSSEILWEQAFGLAEIRPSRRTATTSTVWDLASLTKVLATTTIAMRLVDAGLLRLEMPAADVVSGLDSRITVAHLLHHTSGLPAWLPLFAETPEREWGTSSRRNAVIDKIVGLPLEADPGCAHVYSDLGFLVLGRVLEEVGGDTLRALFRQHVLDQCDADLRWGWPDAAATEDCPVRKKVIVGEVHDLNAAALGGVAPHAGLFGTASSVGAHAAWLLRAARGEAANLSPTVVERFWRSTSVGSHRLGWDGVSPEGSSAGDRWPVDGVGHLAFTGCSVWLAPRQNVSVSFCTNRVHPEISGGAVPAADHSARYQSFRALRPELHTAIVASLEAQGIWHQ